MSDLAGVTRTGLPRPMAKYDKDSDHRLPLPWINTQPSTDGYADFYAFREDCSRAATERLCCVCGDPLSRYVLIAAMGGGQQTSGGWGHPRCIQMAVRLCPHFTRHAAEPVVAWMHKGSGVGVADPTFEVDDVVDSALPMSRSDLAHFAAVDPFGDGPDTPPTTQPRTPAGSTEEATS